MKQKAAKDQWSNLNVPSNHLNQVEGETFKTDLSCESLDDNSLRASIEGVSMNILVHTNGFVLLDLSSHYVDGYSFFEYIPAKPTNDDQ